ncbi:hypothetical protein ASPSYDRAFT_979461 [Aspergillus sydowii CBS 593.65]|uniref:Uncharacterized protein n=1 Tax=Aspergillus sydowii CBS 593.65 TaxID=1036612 RepID=A0A1L9THK6_9EURO|nr:uncharacterized protein ASPSYDRAFT_979461 [Aspergillus sydowii CBS 593.65]OJJ58875.1 hypothetical protein ASPSYDRAFT_979461 [Aspergillus sydowii CBS 593.65]
MDLCRVLRTLAHKPPYVIYCPGNQASIGPSRRTPKRFDLFGSPFLAPYKNEGAKRLMLRCAYGILLSSPDSLKRCLLNVRIVIRRIQSTVSDKFTTANLKHSNLCSPRSQLTRRKLPGPSNGSGSRVVFGQETPLHARKIFPFGSPRPSPPHGLSTARF